MAKLRLADIPGPRRGRAATGFYDSLWSQVRDAAKSKKAVVVEVPTGQEVTHFANKVRQNGIHRIGKGKLGVQVVDGKRQLLVWMK